MTVPLTHGVPLWPTLAGQLERLRWALVPLASLVLTLALRPTWTDWAVHRSGIRQLASSHWQTLYVDQPATQVGPFGLVFGLLPTTLAQIVGALLILPALYFLERIAGGPVLAHGLLLSTGWAVVAVHVQPADLLVVICGLAAVAATKEQRSLQVGLLVGLAALVKPWGIILAPLLVKTPQPVRGASVAVGLAGIGFLPFVLYREAWEAGAPQLGVNLGSVMRLVTDLVPGWWRLVQLVVCLGVGLLAARRGGWAAVLLATTATRLVMDPSSYPYQALAPLAGAVLWDLVRKRMIASWVAFGLLLLSGPWLAVHYQALAISGRVVCLLGLIALSLRAPSFAGPRLGVVQMSRVL